MARLDRFEVDPVISLPDVNLVLSRTHPDDVDRLMGNREELLRGSGTFESEYRLQMPDGRIKNVIVQGNVSTGPDGIIGFSTSFAPVCGGRCSSPPCNR